MINETQKSVVENSAFITLVTLNPDGTAHPIIAGKADVQGDKLIFGIYKMETTQKNLAANAAAWVVAATMDGGPKGFRFAGSAVVDGKSLIFTVTNAEALI